MASRNWIWILWIQTSVRHRVTLKDQTPLYSLSSILIQFFFQYDTGFTWDFFMCWVCAVSTSPVQPCSALAAARYRYWQGSLNVPFIPDNWSRRLLLLLILKHHTTPEPRVLYTNNPAKLVSQGKRTVLRLSNSKLSLHCVEVISHLWWIFNYTRVPLVMKVGA